MTKRLLLVPLSIFALGLSGCTTPRQAYLGQHPELSADHRKLIVAGKLSDHDPVAGMTREEIRLTMGADPWQTTTINGEEVWIWVKKKGDSLTLMAESDRSGSSGSGSFANLPRNDDPEPKKRVLVRTTVFFHGNAATRVDVTEEPLDRS